MFLVQNEQTKLTAGWLNTLATALIAAGTFAPLAALLYGFSNSTTDHARIAVSAVICSVVGFGLHWGGRVCLRRLRE